MDAAGEAISKGRLSYSASPGCRPPGGARQVLVNPPPPAVAGAAGFSTLARAPDAGAAPGSPPSPPDPALMVSLSLRPVLLAVLLAAAAAPTSAQVIRPTTERISTAPGYFVYVLPGERSTQVSVIGTVRAPGFYTISEGLDLGQALALAGGPSVNTTTTEFEQTITIRLFRGQASRDLIYEATLDEFVRDATAYPRMADGDLIEVSTVNRRLPTYRDTLTIVGAAASVVLAITQVVRIFL